MAQWVRTQAHLTASDRSGWLVLSRLGWQVYPKPKPRGFDPLRYWAQYFDIIEVNSTFYRIPGATMTRSWAARVADQPPFRLTAKLVAILMQFPYRFHHTAENRMYLQRLADTCRGRIPWGWTSTIAPGIGPKHTTTCANLGWGSALSINPKSRTRSD
jgi:uncharacterized protein YecE (DUF72 family)